jgi:hypothetical protein
LSNVSDLMGHQSVRATFRLSARFIEALSIVSSQLGLKHKSLFDHPLEDTESLMAIARSQPHQKADKKDRIRKTCVISKKSLSALEKASKEVAASRDDLVKYAIPLLLPILRKERTQQNKREDTLCKIAAFFGQSHELLQEIEKSPGKDDPVPKFFAAAAGAGQCAFEDMEKLVKKGAIFESLQSISLGRNSTVKLRFLIPNRSKGITTAWSFTIPAGNAMDTGTSPEMAPSPAQR